VARSGDWHFAAQVAGALRRAGHPVRTQTIDEVDSRASRSRDVQLVLRGLEPVRRTSGQRHVLWVISHPEALDVAECDEADLVLVASPRFAAHLRTLTDTPVEVFLQATDPAHFHPVAPDPAHRHPVSVVASSRGVARSAVADAVAAGLRPAVHGHGWEGLVDPALVCAPYVEFDQLPAVYAAAGVVLNDHWETMRHWGFVSNRVFDVLACGTTVVSDHLPEIAELFGDLVPTWTDAEDLVRLVEQLSTDADRTAERTRAARELVLGAHTFDHRARELDALLLRHGLVEPRAGDR
jgi:O-antigen biosynthesis protein